MSYSRKINLKELGDKLYSMILKNFIIPYFSDGGKIECLLSSSLKEKNNKKPAKKLLMIQTIL